MGRNTCFVPGCNTGYISNRKKCKEEGTKVKSLFAAPKDAELFEKWKRLIPRKDKELCRNCSICEVHFTNEDVIRNYEIKMPDGSIEIYERSYPKLRAGAVPCLFPNLPSYLSKSMQERKLPMSCIDITPKKCKNSDDFLSELDSTAVKTEAADSTAVEQTEDFNFNSLLNYEIEKPNEWWCVNVTKEFVAYVKWASDFTDERKIIVTQDLSVKVFLKDLEINIAQCTKVSSLNDISSAIKIVDDLRLCAGIKNGSHDTCQVYLPVRESRQGRHTNLCGECRKFKRKLNAASRRQKSRTQRKGCKNLYQLLVSANRKQARLKQKVTRLHEKVTALKKKCSASKAEATALSKVTRQQRESIQACLNAAKASPYGLSSS